jgi:hypothetical protein
MAKGTRPMKIEIDHKKPLKILLVLFVFIGVYFGVSFLLDEYDRNQTKQFQLVIDLTNACYQTPGSIIKKSVSTSVFYIKAEVSCEYVSPYRKLK